MAATLGATRTLDPGMIERVVRQVTSSGKTQEITAPFTGEPLAELPVSTADDVRAAHAAAREAQRAWAALPVRERVRPFLRLHDALLDRREEILDVVQWETGKARRHAFEEVLDVAGCTLYYARRAPGLLEPRRRSGIFPLATRVVETRHPKGVVALISPWNYPLSLGVTDVVPALLAGNAVVHKPDTQTALSTLWTIDLLAALGMPREIWQVVLGDPAEVGDPLLDDADYVAFTGSTRGGRKIAEEAAKRLIGCSLELGGKNPMIVLDDADLDMAAQGALRACFTNAGQLCISIERLYVHEAVHDAFTEKFVKQARNMRLGSGLDWNVQMGSLTSRRQLDAVSAHVDDAVAKGARVLAGGKARPDVGPLFYEPTVLADVDETMDLCREETFGPVVSIYRFATEDEAVEKANDTVYGLNASVWTGDVARGRALAARIKAGTVNVNEGYGSAYASYDAPMGGMKSSGLGRRHGAEGLLKYTEAQNIASQASWLGFEPVLGMTYDKYADTLAGLLKTMKKLHLK
ncbi:succinic semialdehyde dehydrogenase [Planomonospora venezuelensis]|uniref:Aldehyde dehydrogenase (NAD+)/succinate-semialdehyde dehydrogenase/glutarate-semialdehyde dehydrogenase n=1 Tax=Planomonospora venezuelensis TaxID=1999 RepID=A0A841D653_PLAVE|nr:succinic semialdehyde dehydrogenase [Planomonospora venezuelensis]MBB5963947.1 aldehyde dehydrogenase (NAD+)/succinate-semialdehyde dehydrogenase/glutarate-semialdehyde dehydrogenase [Planomonospora venezuelensis]GIN03895.1 succinic semialdehyde dehydrogenase [Planomonospora venezuelensis]